MRRQRWHPSSASRSPAAKRGGLQNAPADYALIASLLRPCSSLPPTVRPESSRFPSAVGEQGTRWSPLFLPSTSGNWMSITTVPQLEFMLIPRLVAVAEMTWTSDDQRDFSSFNAQPNTHLEQFHQQASISMIQPIQRFEDRPDRNRFHATDKSGSRYHPMTLKHNFRFRFWKGPVMLLMAGPNSTACSGNQDQ